MKENIYLKGIYFLCSGIFLWLVVSPALELLGMRYITKLIMIAGICLGMGGLLMPVGEMVKKSEEK